MFLFSNIKLFMHRSHPVQNQRNCFFCVCEIDVAILEIEISNSVEAFAILKIWQQEFTIILKGTTSFSLDSNYTQNIFPEFYSSFKRRKNK